MITYLFLIATVAISLYAMDNSPLKSKLMFNAYRIKHHGEWYRFISSGFIHADWAHLAFNMYALFLFGKGVGYFYGTAFGSKGTLFFVLLYVGGLVFSSLYDYEKNKDNIYYNALGASGAVSAVVYAYIIFAPTSSFYLMFIPIPIPAYIFGLVYLGVEYYLGKKGNSTIGHYAHFFGALHGLVFTLVLKPELFQECINQILR